MIKFPQLICALAALTVSLHADGVRVPNFSFENPPVPEGTPAYPVHVGWQQYPKPAWYDDGGGFSWDLLTGVFKNTAAGEFDHIDNVDQIQAAYLFAVTENGIYQDLPVTFQTGVAYTASVGFCGSASIPPAAGATLDVTLYYRNGANEMVGIATNTVTYNAATFPNSTNLVDFSVSSTAVKSTDAWAGKNIGVSVRSTASAETMGGIWDLDNVRVNAWIPVANHSFEAPQVAGAPAFPFIDSWSDFEEPAGWDESQSGAWDNLTGVFPNPESGQPGRIENMDQAQAAYLFSTPGAGIMQLLDSTYLPGATYTLTVGLVASSSIPPTQDVPIDFGFYYLDESNQRIGISGHPINYTPTNFPDFTHFVDFSSTARGIVPLSPWAGKKIGVFIASAADQSNLGGIWDIDNVRVSVGFGVQVRFAMEGSNLRLSWDSVGGTVYEVIALDDLNTFLPVWTRVDTTITGTGDQVSKVVAIPTTGKRFFEVRTVRNP